jgi:hypothetical protein
MGKNNNNLNRNAGLSAAETAKFLEKNKFPNIIQKIGMNL